MARRIEVGVAVPKIELVMPDGKVYTWELSMYTISKMAEEDDGLFVMMDELAERFAQRPVETFGELMYMGLAANHPEITRENVLRLIPPSEDLLLALATEMADAMGRSMPRTDTANPRTPGAAM